MNQNQKKIKYILKIFLINKCLEDYDMERDRISYFEDGKGKDVLMQEEDNEKNQNDQNNNYKSISQRVNKILNDKTYISTDDMEINTIMNAGNCYHENISPKGYDAKRNYI